MAEYLDILNEDGSLSGNKALRSEVHQKGLLHRSVFIWIINRDKEVLIQKRHPSRQASPNKWDVSAGGHIDAGSDSLTSAIRETKEELGLDLQKDHLNYLFTYLDHTIRPEIKVENYSFFDVYLVELHEIDLDSIKYQEDEVSEVKLIPLKELKKEIDQENPQFTRHKKMYPMFFSLLQEKGLL